MKREEMTNSKDAQLCGLHMRMWPREIFDAKKSLALVSERLGQSGVYVLYRDDVPYYIGQAQKLLDRLSYHALNPNARRYNFWNFFSAFVIVDQKHRNEIEAILIAAMPTANSAKPKIERDKIPSNVKKLLLDIRRHRANPWADPSSPH